MRLLPISFRKRGVLTAILLIVNSMLDVAGLGAVIPVVIVVVEEGAIQNNAYFLKAYETLGFTSNEMFIFATCLLLLMVLLIKNVISVVITYQQASFTFSVEAYFSRNLFRSFYKRGLPYFKLKNSTNILRNVNAVPNSFANGVLLPMISFLNEVVVITVILTVLFMYNPYVVLFMFGIVTPIFSALYYFSKDRIKRYQEENHYWSPKLAKVLFEAVYGFMDVMTTGTKMNFFTSHKRIKATIVNNAIKLNTFKVIPQKSIEFTMFLGVVLIIVYGVFMLETRSELITLLGVFSLAAYRVMPSINRIMMAVMNIKSFEYTIEVMERTDAQQSEGRIDPVSLMPFNQSLVLRNVSFAYSSGPIVVKDASLTLNHGELLGIIGSSGSGKTTLMNIMLGFFVPQDGEVIIDGNPLNEVQLESWQRSVGYVSQDVFMVDGTVKQNVAFGLEPEEIDEEKVWKCLELASMADLVKIWESGINTPVGERGGRLSGGQKQRIGIARALYFDASILFFDEATSALDTETEKEITQSIQRLAQEEITMVLIAHRVTTLRHCDRIIEMSEGRITGELQFNELMDRIIEDDQ